MNIRDLHLFKHLAGSLHFGRTSRACHITPSGLTRAIQRLENELDSQLFFRDKRTVRLTEAGKVFRKYTDDVLNRWGELQNELATDEIIRGELSLYCSVTAIVGVLPAILSRFRNSYPDIQIKLQTGDAAMALTKLENSEVDVTIAALPDKPPRSIDFIKTLETPLIFIASDRFPTAVISHKGVIDWQRTPIIMPERGLSRERIKQWFMQKNIQPNIYSHVAGNEAIIAMVSMGCGIGVVPQLVLEKSVLQEEISILDISPRLEPFVVGVCTIAKNRRNPVVEAFWEIARESGQL